MKDWRCPESSTNLFPSFLSNSRFERKFPMPHVLILCTGNSCRSQMAEVIWNTISQQHSLGWTAVSAGSQPSGYVHANAIAALAEKDYAHDGLISKSADTFFDQSFDLVVTVCDHASEACPTWPNSRQILHWPFDDPADATGSDTEVMACFRKIRDQIETKIRDYLLADRLQQSSRRTPDADTIADARKLISMALTEDTGSPTLAGAIDCTTFSVIPESATASASFISRQDGVVCGIEIVKLAIEELAPSLELETFVQDSQPISRGDAIAKLTGRAHEILIMERTCLNFMCRLSGISSLARQYSDQVAGTDAVVLDTRKTTPGYRRLEKYAVACGGGANHRMGLYDAIMIKDNHLAFYKAWNRDSVDAVAEGIALARKWIADHQATLPHGTDTVLQLEVDTLEQFQRALNSEPDIILLDNMSNEQLASAVATRNKIAPSILLEASGGVNLETVRGIAQTGVDRISVGALTHSAINFDIGLDWKVDAAK